MYFQGIKQKFTILIEIAGTIKKKIHANILSTIVFSYILLYKIFKIHPILPFFYQTIDDLDYELKFAEVYVHVKYVGHFRDV